VNPLSPASLTSDLLARRLADLAGDERAVQADFLLHLDEFDRRRAYLPLGFPSLWAYCLTVLHLREGAAGRRIGAMRVLRRFPALEPALRDGRVCLSTVNVLGPVLTEGNLVDLVARGAFKTKAEVERLVASIQARPAPADGIRLLPAPASALEARPLEPALPIGQPPLVERPSGSAGAAEARRVQGPARESAPPARPPARPECRPVTGDTFSLRVTIDAACKADLDELRDLLSHARGGDLAAVLHEAVRCGLEKHGKRRGAVEPRRARAAPSDEVASDPAAIPAVVRRAVWKRDGGRCTFVSADGRRCGSTWKLELDHVQAAALGGPPTLANLRLRCRPHNLLHAEETFGRAHMAQFVREAMAAYG
jgi:hypothetical protein